MPRLMTLRYMGEFGSGLCESLFRKHTLGHILYRSDVFQTALEVPSCTSHHMQEFNTTIGHHDPVGMLIIAAGLHSPGSRLVYQGYVVGMYPDLSDIRRYWSARFNFMNAIKFLRPHSLRRIGPPRESAGSAQPLTFCEEGLTAPQLLVCPSCDLQCQRWFHTI